MLDYMDACLEAYFRQTAWDARRNYANIAAYSSAVLDFCPPQIPAQLVLARPVSPYLKATYTLAVPPDHHALSFLATSTPQTLQPACSVIPSASGGVEDDGGAQPSMLAVDAEVRSRLWHTLSSQASLPPLSRTLALRRWTRPTHYGTVGATSTAPYLLHGRVWADGTLDGYFSRRLSPAVQLVVSGTSSRPTLPSAWSWLRNDGSGNSSASTGGMSNSPSSSSIAMLPSTSHVHAEVQHQGAEQTTELSFSSAGTIYGLRALRRLYEDDLRTWDIGTELYYAHGERSGGLSMGAHYQALSGTEPAKADLTDVCLLLNPAMGHMAAAYSTSAAARQLTMSARYEFNLYSYESDLAVGLIYAPSTSDEEQPVESKPAATSGIASQVVKFRVGLAQGLAFVWELCPGNGWTVCLGVSTEFGWNPSRTLGIELQYVSPS